MSYTFFSQSARDAQRSNYGDESYWRYLEDKAIEYHIRGIDCRSLTRSLGEALSGNDGQ